MAVTDYSALEVYKTTLRKIDEELQMDNIYENGSFVKFRVSSLTDHWVVLTELENNGTLTSEKKRYKRSIFKQLVYNNYFGISKFARRESYADLRKYDVNCLYRR